jgi:putative ABC transport system permease protein
VFKNYLKIAFRNIVRQKVFSFINIFGFTLGLTVFIIIGLYVLDDLTYDRYHPNAERLYRVVSNDNTKNWVSAVTSGPLLLLLKDEIPEVKASTRIGSFFVRFQLEEAETQDEEQDPIVRRSYVTGPGFFEVFDFKILEGETSAPLEDPAGVYLTEETATAIFGDEDPIGKPLNIGFVPDAFVAGIVEAPPTNSHIQFGAVIPMDINVNPVWWDSWENLTLTGYVLMEENADPRIVNEKIVAVARANGMSEVFTPKLQPLLEMHLNSSEIRYDAFNIGKNHKSVVYGLIVIGILVLIVASINFINLSSARSVKRAREVGMRKVVGAKRNQLAFQFLTESVILTLIAMLFSLAALEILLPHLDNFLGKHLELDILETPLIFIGLMLFAGIVGFVSGIYPALIISGYKPVKVLKGEFRTGKQGLLMRKILVVSQFAVSIALIAGVLIVLDQIRFMQSKDFGYNRDHVIVIPSFDQNITTQSDLFRERVESLSSVISSGRVNTMPGATLPTTEVCFDQRNGDEIGIMFDEMTIDDGFINTLDISVIYGRNFSRDFSSDTTAVLINETAYRLSGWENPIGQTIVIRGANVTDVPWKVVGVIKDIHFGMAKRVIEPMVVKYYPARCALTVLHIRIDEVQKCIEEIQAIYEEVFPDRDFRNFFFDDIFARQFGEDRNFATKIIVFAGLAIIIACLGLFGLSSFMTEQRTKEIGIRKVLGSSITQIVSLLTINFIKWVMIANLIAVPFAYLIMNKWLQNFAYRININIWTFVVSGIVAIIIAFITVSFRTVKAANSNPVEALKYE